MDMVSKEHTHTHTHTHIVRERERPKVKRNRKGSSLFRPELVTAAIWWPPARLLAGGGPRPMAAPGIAPVTGGSRPP